MAKLLYINSNPKPEEKSYSLTVGNAFIDAYKEVNPEDEVITLDLYKMDIPLIDEDTFSAWYKFEEGLSFEELTSKEQKNITNMNVILEQFLSADKYVFVTPLWNFSVPPMMKAYIDNVCIAGKTFKYTENAPVGLLTGKKAIHIQSRGGVYSKSPASNVEMGDKYMDTVLGFIGINDRASIIIEGVNSMADKAEVIKENAMSRAREVAKTF